SGRIRDGGRGLADDRIDRAESRRSARGRRLELAAGRPRAGPDRWPLDWLYGADPAITGEPSEEQLISPVEPNGWARHRPQLSGAPWCASGVVPRRSRTGATSSPCLK